MGYGKMLGALYAARRFGVRFELGRVRAALERLGSPHLRIGAVVQIAGTNGKGSTAAFVEAALRSAGLRVGLYTSPHLCRFTERYLVGGVESDREALARRWAAARPVIAELTFFEQATVLAFMTFADAATQVAVLEVGMGGRLDATNVVDADVAVVTGIALDHMEHLGGAIPAIAREKAGIIKPRKIAVVGAAGDPEGRAVVVAEARSRQVAELVEVDPRAADGWKLGLRGGHQRLNAACALAALDALERATGGGVKVPEAARRAGLAEVRWPGRLEELGDAPRVWLDAAHNPDGAQALVAALEGERFERLIAVAGVSADKDLHGVLAPVARRADLVLATEAPSPRAAPAAEVARVVASVPGAAGRRIVEQAEHRAALQAALAEARGDDLVLVFGSIFLVGAARARLTGEAVDPIAAQDPIR